jgi:hypothetical protein
MEEKLKALETAFKQQYHCAEPVYINYILAELSDGKVICMCCCDGHRTMDEAMICHDSADTTHAHIEVIGAGDVKATIHNVIVKETHTVEFLEE